MQIGTGNLASLRAPLLDSPGQRSDTEALSPAPWSPSSVAGDSLASDSASMSESDLAQLAQQEEAAMARAATTPGPQATTPSRYQHSLALVRRWASKQEEASRAGVDLRKSAFLPKLLSAGAAILSLAIAALAAVGTGGAATPFVVIMAVRAFTLIGDCACAWEDRKRALQVPPGDPLPMGASCVGNLVHGLCKSRDCSDATATKVAAAVNGFMTLGLAVGGLWLGLPHMAGELVKTLPRTGMEMASSLAALWSGERSQRVVQAHKSIDLAANEATQLMLLQSKAEADSLQGAEAPEFDAFCQEVRKEFASLGASGARHQEVQASLDALLNSGRPDLKSANNTERRIESAHQVGPLAQAKAAGDITRGIHSLAHAGLAAMSHIPTHIPL